MSVVEAALERLSLDAIASRVRDAHHPELPAPVHRAPLTELPPGRDLDDALRSVGPVADLSSADLLEVVAAQERAVAALQAAQVEALAELGRRQQDDRDYAAEELTARLRWTSWTAQHRLAEAQRLTGCLPATLSALAEGAVDYPRARVVVRGTEMLDEDDATQVDLAVSGVAGELTTAQLRQRVAVEVAAVDATAAERRARRATAERRVGVTPLPDGQAQLVAEGPAEDVLTMMRALTQAAGRWEPGDERGADARRFDALRDWARAALDGAPAPTGVWRPQVLLTMAASTLVGLDDHPGMLQGYGPVPAGVARRIAADGVLRRLSTDPATGVLVGVDGHTYPGVPPADHGRPDGGPPDDGPPGPGPARGGGPDPGGPGSSPPAAAATSARCPVAAHGGGTYRPGRALDRLVRLRDGTCTFVGCRRPADRCDVDHLVPHPLGPTCGCNLHPLCRRHHRMKHGSGASVRRRTDGMTVWTMPSGKTYVRPPATPLPRPLVRTRVAQDADRLDVQDAGPPASRAAVRRDTGGRDLIRLARAVESDTGREEPGGHEQSRTGSSSPDRWGLPPF